MALNTRILTQTYSYTVIQSSEVDAVSPMRVASACLTPGCPATAIHAGRCATHQRPRQRYPDHIGRPTRQQLGYGEDWLRTSRAFLREYPSCADCGGPATQAHHIVPKRRGGDDDEGNLLPLCRSCHTRRTSRESRPPQLRTVIRSTEARQQFAIRDRNPIGRAQSCVVHICGAPATGKSWLRALIDENLGIPTFGIDDERLELLQPGQHWPEEDLVAWVALEDAIDAHNPCAVETSGRHPNDGPLLHGRRLFTVLCTASAPVRQTRLVQRVASGYRFAQGQPDYVEALLRVPAPTITVDATVDTSNPITSVPSIVRTIEAWLQAQRS